MLPLLFAVLLEAAPADCSCKFVATADAAAAAALAARDGHWLIKAACHCSCFKQE